MFCQSCGAQVTGAFCTKCGARAAQSPQPVQPGGPPPTPPPAYTPPPPPPQQFAPPPQQQYAPPQYQQPQYQPLAAPAKSGSGLKVLFIILAILGVLGMMGVGAVWYGWHKVKEAAASKGVDLDSLSAAPTPSALVRRLNACDLLSKDELSQIVGMPIDRTEGGKPGTHSTCAYFSNSAVDKNTDATTDAINRIKEQSKTSGNQTADQEKAMKEVGNIMRGIAGVGANGLVMSIETESENPKQTMAAFKIAMGIMTVPIDKDNKDGAAVAKMMREDIKGVGDEAIMGPMASMFIFRKGNVSVTIDGRGLTGGRDTEIAIAKRIADKL